MQPGRELILTASLLCQIKFKMKLTAWKVNVRPVSSKCSPNFKINQAIKKCVVTDHLRAMIFNKTKLRVKFKKKNVIVSCEFKDINEIFSYLMNTSNIFKRQITIEIGQGKKMKIK